MNRLGMISRRAAIHQGVGAAASASLWLGGCAGSQRVSSPRPGAVQLRIDRSFAQEALGDHEAARDKLLVSPALATLVRHQRMSGNRGSSPPALLSRILSKKNDVSGANRVLRAWRGRDAELSRYAGAAGRFLPSDIVIRGTLYFVIGYDIGVAAPPDIAINVAHNHFIKAPSEVGHYVTHETHHLGFLAKRKMPPLERLNVPSVVHRLIRFMTQMEGMAVHAAYAGRRAAGAVDADGDYTIYNDISAAKRIVTRYKAVVEAVGTKTLSPRLVGATLGAMSSGERLWYRFGAIVAHRIERHDGVQALVDSVEHPRRFEQAAKQLLRGWV